MNEEERPTGLAAVLDVAAFFEEAELSPGERVPDSWSLVTVEGEAVLTVGDLRLAVKELQEIRNDVILFRASAQGHRAEAEQARMLLTETAAALEQQLAAEGAFLNLIQAAAELSGFLLTHPDTLKQLEDAPGLALGRFLKTYTQAVEHLRAKGVEVAEPGHVTEWRGK